MEAGEVFVEVLLALLVYDYSKLCIKTTISGIKDLFKDWKENRKKKTELK